MSHIGIDGYHRSKAQDERLSHDIAQFFHTPNVKEVLNYLRSITIESVSGANITDSELRHLEGQRYLVGLIERRIQHSHGVKRR